MLPEKSGYQSTKLVQDFVSRKTGSISEAWEKGLAFGYKDCQLWFGVKLVNSDVPSAGTRKHPVNGYYVTTVRSTARLMNEEKHKLEQEFSSDFRDIRRTDNLDSSAIINRMLEYDQFMNLALQDIPSDKTIPEFIFNCLPGMKQSWLRDQESIRNTLLWIADHMMDTEKPKEGSLILLLAMWVELTNAVAIDKAFCKSPAGKAYFDWEEVFSHVKQHNHSLPARENDQSADAVIGNAELEIAKAKACAITGAITCPINSVATGPATSSSGSAQNNRKRTVSDNSGTEAIPQKQAKKKPADSSNRVHASAAGSTASSDAGNEVLEPHQPVVEKDITSKNSKKVANEDNPIDRNTAMTGEISSRVSTRSVTRGLTKING